MQSEIALERIERRVARLRKLIFLNAPEVIVHNECVMVATAALQVASAFEDDGVEHEKRCKRVG
jgi:hypothetical protein